MHTTEIEHRLFIDKNGKTHYCSRSHLLQSAVTQVVGRWCVMCIKCRSIYRHETLNFHTVLQNNQRMNHPKRGFKQYHNFRHITYDF